MSCITPASVSRDARGNALGVFAAARHITGRKKAGEKCGALLEAAPDAIVIVDRCGRIVLFIQWHISRLHYVVFGIARFTPTAND
jgi:PAS domain-containing protein